MSDTLAFLIHHRRYREHDAILDVLTQRYGLLSLLINNFYAKTSNAQSLRSCFQPLTLLEIEVQYKPSSLSKLLSADSLSVNPPLNSTGFIFASYINEIIRLLMIESSPSEAVFRAYQNCVMHILAADSEQLALRHLEAAIINQVGMSFSFVEDSDAQPITENNLYGLDFGSGFYSVNSAQKGRHHLPVFSGLFIQQYHRKDLTSEFNQQAKLFFQLCCSAIHPHYKIKSRDLFIQFNRHKNA